MASVLARQSLALALVVAAVSVTRSVGSSKLLNITNSCVHTVWPEISFAASSAAPNTTGFQLAPGQWEVVSVPSECLGRVWGRTLCRNSTDSSGKFSCATGGPVTVAEFTLDGSGGMDMYDVSLVDGFNLPVMVAPQHQGGNYCAPTGCMVDMNGVGACPPELRVTPSSSGLGTGVAVVGCKSACQAFGSAEYCCTGEYGNPDTCKASAYSELFKKACPLAVSYAYDDGADSIFTCGGGGGGDTTYAITFCPSTTSSGKLSTSPKYSQPPGTSPGNIDGTTPMDTGGSQQVGGSATAPWRIVVVVAVLGMVTAALGALAQFLGLFKLCCNQPAAGAGG